MLDGAYFNRSAAFALGSGAAGPSIVKNANCHCFSMCDLKPANNFLNFWLPNSSTAATMPRPWLSYLHAVYGSQLPDALDLTKFNFFTMVMLIGGASIKLAMADGFVRHGVYQTWRSRTCFSVSP